MSTMRKRLKEATGCDSPFDPKAKEFLEQERWRMSISRFGETTSLWKKLKPSPVPKPQMVTNTSGSFALTASKGKLHLISTIRTHAAFPIKCETTLTNDEARMMIRFLKEYLANQ